MTVMTMMMTILICIQTKNQINPVLKETKISSLRKN